MNLTPLHNGRLGLRALLQIQARAPIPSPGGDGQGEGGPCISSQREASTLDPSPSTAVLDFISSTATLDRYHEIIDPVGWRLDSYRQNPVFQNAHNYGDILFTLGKALITEVRSCPLHSDARAGGDETESFRSTTHSQVSKCLYQRIEFATDVNPIARIAYGLYKGGFLNAVSVGFIPLRWQDGDSVVAGATSANSGGVSPPGSCRRKYLEQELLEVSAVAIPANPDALALGVKSGAVTKADLVDTLDLLRSLTVDYGPWRGPGAMASIPVGALAQRPAASSQLFHFARELRRILRRG
jgi:hypothetical protein